MICARREAVPGAGNPQASGRGPACVLPATSSSDSTEAVGDVRGFNKVCKHVCMIMIARRAATVASGCQRAAAASG